MHTLKIVMVGAGNVAWHLGPALQEAGYDIVQVYSRSMESAGRLGKYMGLPFTTRPDALNPEADMLLFSVADQAIEAILEGLTQTQVCMVHTAGSVPAEVFASFTRDYGVFYPLMTFSRERKPDLGRTPFCLESSNPSTGRILEEMAGRIGARTYRVNFQERRKLHIAAVFACNFTNHMYNMASRYLEKEGMDFGMLRPLILETAEKVMTMSPGEAQTGPAIRNDERILASHREQLKENPELQKLYTFVSDSIRETFSRHA